MQQALPLVDRCYKQIESSIYIVQIEIMEQRNETETLLDPILPPSSAPLLPSSSASSELTDLGVSYIQHPGQVCYERVLPSEAHYYKPPPPPVCTGKNDI